MPPLSRKQFKKDINMESTHSQRGQAKVHTVMSEFKHGTLHTDGKVTNQKQAVAIAMSEAGLSKPKRRKR